MNNWGGEHASFDRVQIIAADLTILVSYSNYNPSETTHLMGKQNAEIYNKLNSLARSEVYIVPQMK